MKNKQRAFLKWAGGKYSLSCTINQMMPTGQRLVEPFVGAGSVFLNADYPQYWLNDINPDLINVYRILQQKSVSYIKDLKPFFTAEYNTEATYYQLRKEFNQTTDSYYRALIFVYMNRHGYNGLCRYNKSGGFNVPFGRYKKPYFPERELHAFAEKAQQAVFTCLPFRDVFKQAQHGDVFYCDPPYVPLSKTASFTGYSAQPFDLDQQADLANAAEEVTKAKQTAVLISNHDTLWTRKIYQNANQIKAIKVARTISQKGNSRNKVGELLALYQAKKS
jgi:DNA adenine methylase